jgi:hypothetical protein
MKELLVEILKALESKVEDLKKVILSLELNETTTTKQLTREIKPPLNGYYFVKLFRSDTLVVARYYQGEFLGYSESDIEAWTLKELCGEGEPEKRVELIAGETNEDHSS